MITTIENKKVIVSISAKGAELQGIRLKEDNMEYMWQGDAKYWGRRAPVLFPIVGRLVNDTYFVDEKPYSLTQHGFARDLTFTVLDQNESNITYSVTSNDDTMRKYPFAFQLLISYILEETSLHVTYEVRNQNKGDMYFSIGGHPGFNCPLRDDESFTDYYLSFSEKETLKTNVLEGPFLSNKKLVIADETTELPLTYDLFKNDALIFESMKEQEMTVRSRNHDKFVKVSFKGFPFVGVWTPGEDAPFLCIEPWYGIADEINPAKDITEKKGIQKLQANETFTCRYSITIG